jgi:hypothetical protein
LEDGPVHVVLCHRKLAYSRNIFSVMQVNGFDKIIADPKGLMYLRSQAMRFNF